jgi:hypothetical protein
MIDVAGIWNEIRVSMQQRDVGFWRKFVEVVDPFLGEPGLPQDGVAQVLDDLAQLTRKPGRPVSFDCIRESIRSLLYLARNRIRENIELRKRVEVLRGMVEVKKQRILWLEQELHSIRGAHRANAQHDSNATWH